MTELILSPITSRFDVSLTPPGSKSLTNRALVLAALADGPCTLTNVLFADDTLVMLDNLQRLGFKLDVQRDTQTVRVEGRNGTIPATSAELFCGNSGTTIRFLTALVTLGHGRYTLDGISRMRQRPIGQLVDLLRNLGARIAFTGAEGFPPIEVTASGLPGGLMRFIAGQSSQFLSAVLQVSSYARNELQVDLVGKQTSWPYVAMTMRLMDQFGHTPHLIRDDRGDPQTIIIPQGNLLPTEYPVEPDASNASYFLATAAIHPGSKVTIQNLGKDSLQGDVGFAELLRRMGAAVVVDRETITVTGTDDLDGIDADMFNMPDMAQTLAVVAVFARGPTRLRGLHTLRVKETDRIAALANELVKLGARIEVSGDDLLIDPPVNPHGGEIDTYDDHRMAMSFSVAGTKVAGVVIKDPQCVNKTYPEFFEDLKKLG